MLVRKERLYGYKQFGLLKCKCIDNSGTINFNEFSGLWKYIEDWKRCFQAFDVDRSGSINQSEMANALRSFGFNVSPKFIATLIQKFDRYGRCLT